MRITTALLVFLLMSALQNQTNLSSYLLNQEHWRWLVNKLCKSNLVVHRLCVSNSKVSFIRGKRTLCLCWQSRQKLLPYVCIWWSATSETILVFFTWVGKSADKWDLDKYILPEFQTEARCMNWNHTCSASLCVYVNILNVKEIFASF